MEAYPTEYTAHNYPLVLLSGFATESEGALNDAVASKTLLQAGGFRLKIDLPAVTGPLADRLLQTLVSHDGHNAPWSGQSAAKTGPGDVLSIREVGRAYTLPPRKAPPPPQPPWAGPTKDGGSAPVPLSLHSPLSPLTMSSPLFPDGLMTPLWMAKHQTRLPAALIVVSGLTSNTNASSLLDNRLKSEIGNTKSVLSSTNYKTKLVVVLLGEDIIPPSELEERLAMIRRSAALDTKSLYFLPSGSSHVEVTEFVRHLVNSIMPYCIEYYRELSKHARRKRNRSAIPQTTAMTGSASAQSLSANGWNVRYEYKLAVFAEFRQEMDAACRNYETAHETLLTSDLMDTISPQSSRFLEARLLADSIALRIIRCQLRTAQPTAAVRTWRNHRDRISSLVQRKKTTERLPDLELWQSTWARVMADIVARVHFSKLLTSDIAIQKPNSLFAPAERALSPGEPLSPWDHLHHEGYWLRLAGQYLSKLRHAEVRDLPNMDRLPPDLIDSVITCLHRAAEKFSETDQLRTVEYLRLRGATEHMAARAWVKALEILKPFWNSGLYRRNGWWSLLQETGQALLHCASQVQDPHTLARVKWELASSTFGQGHEYGLLHAPLQPSDALSQPAIVFAAETTVSGITPTFVFASAEAYAGEILDAQLALRSNLPPGTKAITANEVRIVFDGSLPPVILRHADKTQAESTTSMSNVSLSDPTAFPEHNSKRSSAGATPSVIGFGDLSIGPQQTKIFNLRLKPRESGDLNVASITSVIVDALCSVTLIQSRFDDDNQYWWESKSGKPTARRFGKERDAGWVTVLPKPPKLSITAPDLKQNYYTNETISVRFKFSNDETVAISGSIVARLFAPLQGAANIKWVDQTENEQSLDNSTGGWIALPQKALPKTESASSFPLELLLFDMLEAVDNEVEVVVTYFLGSDLDTPLVKTSTFELPLIRPFEATYEFESRLADEPWPNFFACPDIAATMGPHGLKQQFNVISRLCSLASEQFLIDNLTLRVQDIEGEAVCNVSKSENTVGRALSTSVQAQPQQTIIQPDETRAASFDMTIQQIVLGHGDPVQIDLALDITWRRTDSDHMNQTSLAVPRFVAPVSEPRVLLTVDYINEPTVGLRPLLLKFTIENPSMHYVRLNLHMEPSEDFVFSGPKANAVSLVPISRHCVRYQILPNKQEQWVKVKFSVVDPYFGKGLKIQPASDAAKADQKNNIYVWAR